MEVKTTKTVKFLSIIFILLTIIHVLYATYSMRGLYLDDLFLLTKMLDNISLGRFVICNDFDHPRYVMQFLQQAPVMFAGIVLKISSKKALMMLHSLMCFGIPLIALYWNYKLTQRTKQWAILFWSVVSYAAMILFAQIFPYVESFTGIVFQFVLLNYLFGKIHYTKRDKIGIFFLLIAMFGIYEYTIILGILLFIGTFFTLFDEENPDDLQMKLVIGAGSLFASAYTIFFVILNKHEHSDGIRFFKEMFDFIPHTFDLNFGLFVITAVLLCLLIFKKGKLKLWQTFAIGLIYVAYLANMVTDLNTYLVPMWEIHMRSIPCWAMPAIFAGIVIYRYFKMPEQKELINRAYVPVLFCGIVLTCWQMVHTYYWNENINYIREKLDNCGAHIYVPAADEDLSSFFNEDLRRYIWANGYPALSILSNKKYKTKAFLFPPEETKSPADETYLSHIWVSKERGIISIPIGMTLSIRNKFWDLSDCVDEMENYIESTGVETTKPENPDDILYP